MAVVDSVGFAFVVFIVAVLEYAQTTDSICFPNSIYGKVCYSFHMPAPMADARARCAMDGGSLASPTDRTDNAMLAAMLRNFTAYRIWLDGEEVQRPWLAGNDDFDGWREDIDEIPQSYSNCAVASTAYKYKWERRRCSDTLSFVCRKPHSDQTICLGVMDAGGAFCYRFHLGKVSWYEAYERCRLDGGALARVDSKCSQAFLRLYLLDLRIDEDVWIGYTGTSWLRANGEPLSYYNWQKGQPNGDDQACLVMMDDGTWLDRRCTESFPFICKTVVSTEQKSADKGDNETATAKTHDSDDWKKETECRNGLVTGLACSSVIVALVIGAIASKIYMDRSAKLKRKALTRARREASMHASIDRHTNGQIAMADVHTRPDFMHALKYSSNSFTRGQNQPWTEGASAPS